MKHHKENSCPMCGGKKTKGTTTFTTDLGFGVVVIRHVPALICSLCGDEWIDDKTASQIQSVVLEAKKKHHEVEITSFPQRA